MQGEMLIPSGVSNRPGEAAISLPRYPLPRANLRKRNRRGCEHLVMTSALTDGRRASLAEFRFQPFKKCFHVKCSTVFVPGDFKPSSPRRMFCSLKCFEAHWRDKLSRFLEDHSSGGPSAVAIDRPVFRQLEASPWSAARP